MTHINSAKILPVCTLPLPLFRLSAFGTREATAIRYRPIEVHELQDVAGVCDVVDGMGLLHATVVPAAVVAAPAPPCHSLWVPAPCGALAALVALVGVVGSRVGLRVANLLLVQVDGVKEVASRARFPLQWPGKIPSPSEASGSLVPEVAAPRRHLVLPVKVLQGLFVGIDGLQRAEELRGKALEGLEWLRRVEIVAPGAGTVAVQKLLADMQPLAIVTILAPTKLPLAVVVIVAYLCAVGGDMGGGGCGLPKACNSKCKVQIKLSCEVCILRIVSVK